jgi:hypothetical protein
MAKAEQPATDAEYKVLELLNAGKVEQTLNDASWRGWQLGTYQVSGEGMNTRHYLLLTRRTKSFLENLNGVISGVRQGTWDHDPRGKEERIRQIEMATGVKFNDIPEDEVFTYIP